MRLEEVSLFNPQFEEVDGVVVNSLGFKYSLRFLPAFIHMKKAIQDELIGPLNDISVIDISVKMGSLLHQNYDWLCDDISGGGCLNIIASHVIDLIHYLTGQKATRVHGIVRTFKSATEYVNGIRQISAPDFCNFQMELENGILCTVNIQSNQFNRNSFEQNVSVIGRDGMLNNVGGDLICLKKKDMEYKEEKLYLDVQDLRITSTPDTSLPRLYVKGLCKMISALKEAFSVPDKWIQKPVEFAASFSDGLYVQAVIEAIKKSSDDKCWVRVSIMTESPNNQAKFLAAARLGAVAIN